MSANSNTIRSITKAIRKYEEEIVMAKKLEPLTEEAKNTVKRYLSELDSKLRRLNSELQQQYKL